METARGIVGHAQLTSRVSGGGGQSGRTTTYIALFRLGQRQVQFSSGSPLSVTDGDEAVIAGRVWRNTFYADAVRNATTGITRHGSIVGRSFFALFILLFGLFATLILVGWFGQAGLWGYGLFVVGAIYLVVRAVQTGIALHRVNRSVP